MKFEDDFKWQHFAFEADSNRARDLAKAVSTYVGTADGAAIFSFYDEHAASFAAAQAAVRIDVPAEEARHVVEACLLAFEMAKSAPPENADELRAKVLSAKSATATTVNLGRFSWEVAIGRSARLASLVRYNVPADVVENEAALLRDALRGLVVSAPSSAPSSAPASSVWKDDALGCASSCIELCSAPFAENIGIRGGYDLYNPVGEMYFSGGDPFEPDALMPDHTIPNFRDVILHHEVLERLEGRPPKLLGTDGDAGPVAMASGDELLAFASSITLPELEGVDSMQARNPSDDPTKFVFVTGVEEEDLVANLPLLRRRVEAYATACRAIHARGATLLTWIAKNPAY
jgi:hypothetical protein